MAIRGPAPHTVTSMNKKLSAIHWKKTERPVMMAFAIFLLDSLSLARVVHLRVNCDRSIMPSYVWNVKLMLQQEEALVHIKKMILLLLYWKVYWINKTQILLNVYSYNSTCSLVVVMGLREWTEYHGTNEDEHILTHCEFSFYSAKHMVVQHISGVIHAK